MYLSPGSRYLYRLQRHDSLRALLSRTRRTADVATKVAAASTARRSADGNALADIVAVLRGLHPALLPAAIETQRLATVKDPNNMDA